MSKSRQLVIVGQTPPPHNGQAKMICQMMCGLRDDFDLQHIRMAYSDSVATAGKFGMSKLLHLVHLIWATRRVLKSRPGSVLYYPPASPNLMPVLRDILYLLAVRPLAGKTVFHFHSGGVSSFVSRRKWLLPLARIAYGGADVAIELGQSCPRDGSFFRADRSVVIPNGVDVPAVQKPRGSRPDVLRILSVGIHTEEKGMFTLLETARELITQGVEFKIRTAGLWYTRQERARFEVLSRQWNLDDKVETCGRKTGDELWALYEWADVFFFPTFYPWETFGIVQLEAMAFCLPVVASDWAGPRDVVLDGATGILCPARDAGAFAEALRRLAQDNALRQSMGSAGRRRYEGSFTEEAFIRNVKQVFSEVCV